MEKINWTTYIAANNPTGANSVLYDYGYLKADNSQELIEAIDLLQQEQGEKATIDLLKQHPDYDIIVDIYKQTNEYRNASGESETEIKPAEIKEQPIVRVSNNDTSGIFSATLKDVILVVMAFWLINRIISK